MKRNVLEQRTRSRGQVMVLSVTTLVLLAVMLMVSFNLTNAIHEKIRLQNAADSHAYASAVITARTMNALGHWNRALAAMIVAQMGLHAWHTVIGYNAAMFQVATIATADASKNEALRGCNPWTFNPVCCFYHAPTALAQSIALGVQSLIWQVRAANTEGRFDQAVRALQTSMNQVRTVHQRRIVLAASALLGSTAGVFDTLRNLNAPRATYAAAPGGWNARALACALERSDLDNGCVSLPGMGSAPARDNTNNTQSRMMNDAANAARKVTSIAPGVLANQQNFFMGAYQEVRNAMIPRVGNRVIIAPYGSIPMVQTFASQTRPFFLVPGGINPGRLAGNQLATAVGGGVVSPPVMVIPFDIPGLGPPANAWAYSGNGAILLPHGTLFVNILPPPLGVHTGLIGGHANNYRGVPPPPCGNNNAACFVNLRLTGAAEANDFRSPRLYGALTANLRDTRGGANPPWEVNANARVTNPVAAGSPGSINLAARNNRAAALAVGMTYFHQLGQNGWRVPPNLFDPFWRAKLHFFRRGEFAFLINSVMGPGSFSQEPGPLTSLEGARP